MNTSIKLLIAGVILLFLIPFWTCKIIGLICLIGGIILIIYQGITKIKAGSNKYANEARKAYERTTPKKDKYATPPWEE